MTGQLDLDRVLDAFLADGPRQIPDRVVNAALTEIEHTHQRPGLPAPWRFFEMPNSLKLTIAAAAVLAVALGGAFLLGRGGQPGVGAIPPSASATPTPASATPTPAAVTITFSDDACEVTGAEALSAGPALVRSVNETSKQVTIDVWRLHPDRTYGEFVDDFAIEQARVEQGLNPSAPLYVTMSTGALLETTGTEEAWVTLPSGTHAVTCIAFEGDRAVTLLLTGPIEISP
jgi:hypothetical protein